MKPLSDSLGWSRGSIALSLSIAAVAMAIANPLVGRLIDRLGVKFVLIASLLSYGAATAGTPFLIESFGIRGLYVGFALIAALGAGSNVIAYVRVLSGWFSGILNHRRGLAMGFASAGLALGHMVTGPLAVQLIAHFGWRGGFLGLALLPLAIGIPIAILGVRMAPGDAGDLSNPVSTASLPGLTASEAVRTRQFWLMIAVVLLMSACLQGFSIHLSPLVTDLGMTPDELAWLLAATGALGIVARVGAGFLFDRFFAPRVSLCIFALATIATWSLALTQNIKLAIVAALAQVIGSGAESDLIAYLIGRYFGLKAYGQIFGWVYGVFMVGIALGPYLFGVAFDVWRSYQIPLIAAGAGLLVVCALLLAMPRFPPKLSEAFGTTGA